MVTFELAESDGELMNPERGYYTGFKMLTESDEVAQVRADGHTLAIAMVRLDAFRAAALDSATLAKIRDGFDKVRAGGIKVVLRFTYASDGPDAPKAIILQHISQLTPILQENADVIAVMQAGFIGKWGEWHSSSNNLTNPTDRKAIMDAILTALPATRQLQLRTPMYKEEAYPGGPMTADEAYTSTPRGRLGHHNDCFLASVNDYGTYASPADEWRDYVGTDGQYTAIGGETCAVYAPMTTCEAAVTEMENNHWSYLNSEYHQTVIAGFDAQGCGDEIRKRLGYRFSVVRVAHTERVAPGGVLDVEIDVRNSGFASLYNERPIELVLRGDNGVRLVARMSGRDARSWRAGATTTLTARLRLPADLEPGSYELAMRLPDAYPTLADDARYAIQLANETTFHSNGDNTLSDAVLVDVEAPGPRDGAAVTFAEISE